METIIHTPADELSEYWGIKTTEEDKLFNWIELVDEHAHKIPDTGHLHIKEMLTELALK